jgi:hypothetical protein
MPPTNKTRTSGNTRRPAPIGDHIYVQLSAADIHCVQISRALVEVMSRLPHPQVQTTVTMLLESVSRLKLGLLGLSVVCADCLHPIDSEPSASGGKTPRSTASSRSPKSRAGKTSPAKSAFPTLEPTRGRTGKLVVN